jgi:tetratricopeptide (TPR) repeat protein
VQSLIDAERRVRDALAATPNAAALHDDLGTILARLGRHAEAIPAFERALQLDARLPHTRKRLADALAASGRGHEADQIYSQYFAQDPDRQAIVDRRRAPARRDARPRPSRPSRA